MKCINMTRRKRNEQPRKLWLHVRVKGRDGQSIGLPSNTVLNTLIDSIQRGDYVYPSDWIAEISWRNKELDPMKTGEFTEEMKASRVSSPGWDSVVLSYLRRKLK